MDAYDAANNRTSMVNNGTLTTYTYDANNRMLTETEGGTTKAYTYDANGNQLTGDGATYTYNARGQQTGYSKDGVSASYTYLPTGLRKSKTVGITTTNYVWDGQNMVYEYNGTNTAGGTPYYYGLTLISLKNDAYYLYNAHGDVVQLVSSTGSLGWNYEYDAFGNELTLRESDSNPFRYAGQYYDKETGTYYLRARYYDPSVGRFTQQDGWQFADPNDPLSLNLYTYCLDNPVLYVDPEGTIVITISATAAYYALTGLFALTILAFSDDMLEASAEIVRDIADVWDDSTSKRLGRNESIDLAIREYKIGPDTKTADNVDKDAKQFDYFRGRIHHIVAQGAWRAKPAQIILEAVGRNVHDSINLVVIPHGVHKGLHTVSYYEYINKRLIDAFKQAKNEEMQRINVDATLVELQMEIIGYSMTGKAPWIT